MPLKHYGVLKGRPVDKRLGTTANAHYHVDMVDEETHYRIAVNVQSQFNPFELEYLVDDAFQHPLTDTLVHLPLGFKQLDSKPGSLAIDFIRSNVIDRSRMVPLPFDLPGPDNDLNEKIDRYISRAMSDEDAMLYAFGQRWGLHPVEPQRDKIFGFKPSNGIHNIHMNQGNAHPFQSDDGVYQDGALFIHIPSEQQWVGIFLKFQSQTWHTDDATGHRIKPMPVPKSLPTPIPDEPDGIVRIVGALVNPVGPAPEAETVTLLNPSPYPIDLAGWAIANQQKQTHHLTGLLDAGATIVVQLPETLHLGNQGGIITLLNQQGLKVDGVAYTREQAQREGWTIMF
jgi:uncharacterized protein YukJ